MGSSGLYRMKPPRPSWTKGSPGRGIDRAPIPGFRFSDRPDPAGGSRDVPQPVRGNAKREHSSSVSSPSDAGAGRGAAAAAVLMLLPNPMHDQALKEAEEKQWVQEQDRQVQEMKEKLKSASLPEPAKRNMEKELNRLDEALDRPKDARAALEEMEKTMKELNKQAENSEKAIQRTQQLAEEMKKQASLKQAAEALQQGRSEELQKALDSFASQVMKLSPIKRRRLRRSWRSWRSKLRAGKSSSR
ncbi:hypothetical protein N6H14_33535 [Paenibacillus sp. CC-CFT747]|nr:hypothetical protein N6H14_33535 [Paenibacillus sp. CC-CFT747]